MDHSSNSFSATLESLDGLNGDAVIVLLGELDVETVPELSKVLDPLVEDGPRRIILECSGLSFLDSSGLALLVAGQNRLGNQGRHLVVRSPRPNASKVIEITGLKEFLKVDAGAAQGPTS